MKAIRTGLAIILITFLAAGLVAAAEGMTRSVSGLTATLKADPEKSMVDLFLVEASSKKPITDAKVKAVITTPGGKVEKELVGMKMDGVFSFMNTLDMSKKGVYSFDVQIKRGSRSASFQFTYENR